DSGAVAIVPGKPDKSELLHRISSTEEGIRMPPEGKPLSAEEVANFRRWIEAGAKWEDHWAFQPVQPQQPPKVKQSAWVRNPIDAFILSRLERNNLRPVVPAGKAALLRRAYYDLTGLPPTPAETDAFLMDNSADAYERVIDKLLSSERYGERWARHWLDVVRFAETNSFERDGVKPNAWRYRDYVIDSLNADKPYDQFIREQLAGDELPGATHETIIATGYYRLGLWDDEPADRVLARFEGFDDLVTTTGQAFLGMTINCARCHDHKIDPIPQADYYKLVAFFQDVPHYDPGNSQTDISSPELLAMFADYDRQKRDLREQLQPIEQRGIVKMSAEDQRKSEGNDREKLLKEKLLQLLSPEDAEQYKVLKAQWDELQNRQLPARELALSIQHSNPRPPATHVMLRGNPRSEGPEVQPGFPDILNAPDPVIEPAPQGARSSGRRTVLANWIASADNPLTARVMVNRVWQHHFGRGIVRSPNNFGLQGDAPTHPELLDWLSGEFVRNGWSLKKLHRAIMLSNTYRLSSAADPKGLEADPTNNLFWRFNMRRLGAEEIRDSIHAVTGKLNLQMHGPGYYPEISAEVLAGQSQPGAGWGKSSPEEQARRSIYIHVKRSLITPILGSFDFPETDSSCEARFVTTLPTQSLGMLNGKFVNDQAVEFSRRLRAEAGKDPAAQVRLALRLALCRPISDEEVDRGVALLSVLNEKYRSDKLRPLELYCLAVLNFNEFVYLD
ncbi:MAG: PSD1 and planctomycete cytochrome C domain-containing protein, partial [Pirellulales bacterium]